jgi:uncharacterized protein YjaZ
MVGYDVVSDTMDAMDADAKDTNALDAHTLVAETWMS